MQLGGEMDGGAQTPSLTHPSARRVDVHRSLCTIHTRAHLPHTNPMAPMHRLLQSQGNFIVRVAGKWEGASVMIEAQEAATKGAHVAVPEGLVPEAIQGVD